MKLSEEAAMLRQKVLETNDFEGDVAGVAALDSGMRSLDVETACMKIVERDGYVVTGDRGQIKSHPLLATARDARSHFLAVMKSLKLLDIIGEPKAPGRPTEWERYSKGKTYAGGGR